jgi:hypothetical protein
MKPTEPFEPMKPAAISLESKQQQQQQPKVVEQRDGVLDSEDEDEIPSHSDPATTRSWTEPMPAAKPKAVDFDSVDSILASLSPTAPPVSGVHGAMVTAESDYCASLRVQDECVHTQKDHARHLGLPICTWVEATKVCSLRSGHSFI